MTDLSQPPGPSSTHDWTASVDLDHLASIRSDPAGFVAGGTAHLLLEVLAYAADEAEALGGGSCVVTWHRDGSVAVADTGRGTAVRVDGQGRTVRKPVMSTKDLRFFDSPGAQTLPDGHPRRGISVVAALSDWLVHTNRRIEGAWTQRYERGVPVTDLQPEAPTAVTGTTVHFHLDAALVPADGTAAAIDPAVLSEAWPWLAVELRHEP